MAWPKVLTDSAIAKPSIAKSGGRSRGLALLDSAALRTSVGIWVLTRTLFLVLTYFGVILFESTLHGAHPSFIHQLLPAWQNPINHGWDTSWYIDIAQRGYAWKKAVGTSPTAFFPLYPMLIRGFVTVTLRSYLTAALVISNVAFFAALLYLWRLTALELGREVAGRTLLYIAIFPTALFFFAGYTESLFLFLTVACFFHMRRQQWWLAGIFGGLAAATRVTGVLLAVPFAYEYARTRQFSYRRADLQALAILLVPAGLLAFMLYLHSTVGDAFAFTHNQAAWQKVFTWHLWSGILESVRQIVSVQPDASFLQAHNVLNLGIGLLFLALSVLAARRLPPAYGLYLAAFWLVTLSSPALEGGYPVPLVSLSRYVLSLFPVFMIMGQLGVRRELHDAYLVVAVGLLSLLTVQFITGGWVV